MGNKVDMDDQRMVSEKMAKQWSGAHGGCPYFETSAKTDQNVGAAFERVVRLALEAEPEDEPFVPETLEFPGAGGRPAPRSACC